LPPSRFWAPEPDPSLERGHRPVYALEPMSATPEPLPVATIIAAYNRAGMVAGAVASALAQRPNPPAEVIVVDDASSDETAAVAEQAGARVIRHETNQGAAVARNTGIAAAGQPWVAPLDSDDRWLPGMLATLWPRRAHHAFVAGSSIAVDELDRPLAYGGVLGGRPVTLSSPAALVYPENFVAASGVLIDRQAFDEVGGYRAGGRQAEDFDLWLRILERRTGLCLPDVVTMYRVHAEQKSRGGASSRAAVLEIIERYRGRDWWSEELLERRRAVMAWDELREAIRVREARRAAGQVLWLGRSAPRWAAVTGAVRRRRAGRRRAARFEA
jgi:glycosyltransferase involved in cell wall biosynthesis